MLGDLLVVSYSESSGDDRMVEALDGLPRRFGMETGAAAWAEPR